MTDYVHRARIELAADADPRAPGGAITVALCGHWDHEPPCRWPHHTEMAEAGDSYLVTTTFTVDPADEPEVRRKIVRALAVGSLTGPDGRRSRWSMHGEA